MSGWHSWLSGRRARGESETHEEQVLIWVSRKHSAVRLKLTQCSQSTTLQYKVNIQKEKGHELLKTTPPTALQGSAKPLGWKPACLHQVGDDEPNQSPRGVGWLQAEQGTEWLLVQTLLCSEHTLWEASGGSSSALRQHHLGSSLSKQNQHKQGCRRDSCLHSRTHWASAPQRGRVTKASQRASGRISTADRRHCKPRFSGGESHLLDSCVFPPCEQGRVISRCRRGLT